MKLLNLDKFIAEDRFFEIQGVRFRVPGLIPVGSVLAMSKLGQDMQSDPLLLSDALRALWVILAPANPERTEAEFCSLVAAPMLKELLFFIFNDQGGEVVDENGETRVDISKNESGGKMAN